MDDHAGGPRRVGFLADTHSAKADGSDLPDEVLAAFAGVDLVVHLGDIGRKGILDRLLGIAPVLVPVGGNEGHVPWQEGGTASDFGDEPLAKLLQRRFEAPVGAVAFGGTHRPMELSHEGVLFFNPGSPTLPVPGSPGAVAVLDLGDSAPRVDMVTIVPAG